MSEWGPGNPHPLSKMTTELVWEGKYDEYGNRRQVDVADCAMPMQKIETIDQPRSEAAAKGKQDLLAFEKETSAATISATASSGATTSSSWPAFSPSSRARST